MGIFFGYSNKVSRLHDAGMDEDEIAEELGIDRETVQSFIQDKCSYYYEEDEE